MRCDLGKPHSQTLKMLSIGRLAAAALLLGGSAVQVAAQGKPTSLSIVHVNDHHSHFDTTSLDVYAPLVPKLSVNTSHIRVFYGTCLAWNFFSRYTVSIFFVSHIFILILDVAT